VTAHGSSQVTAHGSSQVTAYGSSQVTAYGSSQVRACDSSQVTACDSSQVTAYGNCAVHVQSVSSIILLFSFAVAILVKKGKVQKKSKTATIIIPKPKPGLAGWFDDEMIENRKNVTLFKKVSKDFKTQEWAKNETLWSIGITVEHPAWNPKDQECGEGKYHACSKPFFCDEFRNQAGDRYVAIEIEKKDLYLWPKDREYQHKIAFRKGKVLYECDWDGKKLDGQQ
jgi:hypothetical protein